jgi:hypothetical protein
MPIIPQPWKPFLAEVWKKMSKPFLLVYFVIVAILTAYLTCTLWLAAPKEPCPCPPAPGASQANAQASTDKQTPSATAQNPSDCKDVDKDPPKIMRLDPADIAIGENYVNVAIFGCNFKPQPTATFNGVERMGKPAGDNELIVPLLASDFAAPGNIAVSVVTKDTSGKTTESSPFNLKVKSASDIKTLWTIWPWEQPFTITLELRLILLVLFTGAFAASISGLKSLVDYIGNNKFDDHWFLFYIADPVLGSGVAFVFYLVLRGGLLAGSNLDVKAVNPYGFVAVAAMVGLFSDDALRKLNEVAETIFKSQDTRAGKLADPVSILQATLSPVPHGAPIPAFTFVAKNGTPPYTWAVVGALPAGLTLSAAGVLTGTAPAAPGDLTFTVKVTDSTGASATQDCKLTVQ